MSDFQPVVYVKGDDERVADSQAKAVALAWDGFKPKQDDQVEETVEDSVDTEDDAETNYGDDLEIPKPSPSLFN